MDSADEDRGEEIAIPMGGSGDNKVAAGKWLRGATLERRLLYIRKRKSFVEVDLSAHKYIII
jgi:hypothetical protein